MIAVCILIILEYCTSVYLHEYEDQTHITSDSLSDEEEFEPVITLSKEKEKTIIIKDINCDDFAKYVLNCTVEAAFMYNSSRKAPPMPTKIMDWCRAIRHLSKCAIDWNSDCKDVTDSHFNEESISGHMHVLTNVCDDESFLANYDILPKCIEASKDEWERCYAIFESLVDEQKKNTTHKWTHYKTHFYMCCARGQFRRCTLDGLFDMPQICPYEHAVTLQKFSVIVSEGYVYQDCEHNMMYENCPGGDPRPKERNLDSYLNRDRVKLRSTSSRIQSSTFICKILFLYGFIYVILILI